MDSPEYFSNEMGGRIHIPPPPQTFRNILPSGESENITFFPIFSFVTNPISSNGDIADTRPYSHSPITFFVDPSVITLYAA